MENKVFREKSLERISSPDKLDNFVRVANPDLWNIVAAAAVLIFGFLVWGMFGRYEKDVQAVAVVSSGKATLYVSENGISNIKAGQTILIKSSRSKVKMFTPEPVEIREDIPAEELSYAGISDLSNVYSITADFDISDGIYKAKIDIEDEYPFDVFFEKR